jgi:hypothetical protein
MNTIELKTNMKKLLKEGHWIEGETIHGDMLQAAPARGDRWMVLFNGKGVSLTGNINGTIHQFFKRIPNRKSLEKEIITLMEIEE